MVSWRPEEGTEQRPEVLGKRNFLLALVLHLAAFIGFYIFASLHGLFKEDEQIVPIDLTVVVNENLDGEENEPPPLRNPEPEPPKPKPAPPKPKPAPPKKLEPPKPLEQIVTNVVVKKEAPKKKSEPPKKEPPKKEEPKKSEPPKKTAKELREERMKRMRESAVLNKKSVKIEVKNAKSGNGRTERKTLTDADVIKMLNAGYKPGTKEQLATSDAQLGISLIKMALDDKWNRMSPKVGASGRVQLSAKLDANGGLVNVRISQSCGDRLSDEAALSVARKVNVIRGLPAEFLKKFRSEAFTINYDVQGK